MVFPYIEVVRLFWWLLDERTFISSSNAAALTNGNLNVESTITPACKRSAYTD